MADKTPPTKHERPTLSDQLARQHELLMAQATKPARTGSQTVEFGKQATGADAGTHYLKSLVLVQHDGESDVQFLGRQEERLRAVLAMLDTINAERREPDATGEGDAK